MVGTRPKQKKNWRESMKLKDLWGITYFQNDHISFRETYDYSVSTNWIRLHREDGPAYIDYKGRKQWWVHGKRQGH